jgi:hypothetical protein
LSCAVLTQDDELTEGVADGGGIKVRCFCCADFEERTALVADDELTEALDQPDFQIRID